MYKNMTLVGEWEGNTSFFSLNRDVLLAMVWFSGYSVQTGLIVCTVPINIGSSHS